MPKITEESWFRIVFIALVQPVLPPCGLLPTFIHESTHWLTGKFVAFISGIPLSEVRFGFHGINPGITIPDSFPPEYLSYFFFSGGLTAGLLMLILYSYYFIKICMNNPTSFNHVISILILCSSSIHFYYGYY